MSCHLSQDCGTAGVLSNLISEVTGWIEAGVSVFQAELVGMEQAHAPPIT